MPALAEDASADRLPSAALVEVDRLAITSNGGAWTGSGWLVLNPATRRAYQIFETTSTTVVESFDLDSLASLRRLELQGLPVPTGRRNGHLGAGGATASAEVIHAVDEDAGIVYLALADLGNPVNQVGTSIAQQSSSPDARLLPTRWVAIDEKALDQGREAVASFKEPATQPHLRTYWPMGMEVDRTRLGTSTASGRQVGTLILLFAQPNDPEVPLHHHELVRWDVSTRLAPNPAARAAVGAADFAEAREDGRRVLDMCRSSTVTAGTGHNTSGSGGQWRMLVRRDAIAFVCHPAYKAASMVMLQLEDDGGFPAAGGGRAYPLGKPVYDTVVDRAGGHLLLRSTTPDGETWWVFDAKVQRFTGSLAAKVRDTGSMTTGLDQGSGRFYMLLADYNTTFAGKERSVRGGLHFADTRLFDPVPFENVRPDLAYPAFTAIRVDPQTRRVFVRRGKGGGGPCARYPNTQSIDTCPPEPYYRVLKDTIPVPQEPAEGDDGAFTTDVAEQEGVTRASYLGTGSGYGVRSMLVGGVWEATFGLAGSSPCGGKDDRWTLSGSAGPISVSDLSTAALATSLDADAGTQKVMAAPLSTCFPGYPAAADTSEFSFDRRRNTPPYPAVRDGDGLNDYQAACIGEGQEKPPPVSGNVRRDRFVSEVTCDQRNSTAEGIATGELILGLPPTPAGMPAGAAEPYGVLSRAWDAQTGGVRVAKGHSEVKVTRKLGSGIVTTVDSWARGVVIPGLGEIGAVRGEATVRAAGTPGTASARFERTICDIDFGGFQHLGCLDLEKDGVVARLNEAAVGTAEFRLRDPDPKLERGSRSGFQAAIQRDRLDRFGDRIIARDESLAVPALEIVMYRGTGRQVLHLAAAEASVSYGLACLYGQRPDGKCVTDGDSSGLPDEAQTTIGPDGEVITIYEEVEGGDGTSAAASGSSSSSNGSKEPRIVRLIKRIPGLVADALRLIFNNPGEFGLMAAVWALLYAPCYLGERRRSIRALRARRAEVVRA